LDVNLLTGITTDEKSQSITAKSSLSISRIKKDDNEMIYFESKQRTDNDVSEKYRGAVNLEDAEKLILALKKYQELCRSAGYKKTDSTEVLYSKDPVILTFVSRDRGHKNFYELNISDACYVLNTQILITKLVSIISKYTSLEKTVAPLR